MSGKLMIGRLLRYLAGIVDGLSTEQVDALISGRARLEYVAVETSAPSARPEPLAAQKLLEDLKACGDREHGKLLLSGVPTLEILVQAAKLRKVRVIKGDRREDVEAKLMEAVLGTLLRGHAMKTLKLKAGADSGPGDPTGDG